MNMEWITAAAGAAINKSVSEQVPFFVYWNPEVAPPSPLWRMMHSDSSLPW